MADTLNIIHNGRCRFLTSKEMFVEVEGQPAFPGGSGLFWCSQTQTCLGPDGQLADDQKCHPGRACYSEV